jgi:AraC-like DNA-binding protein
MDALKQASDVCLLSTGATATARPVANSEVMMYEIPNSSVLAFANSDAEYRGKSLCGPHFAADSFLHMLSRSIRPLVGTTASCSADFVENFFFTLYSHLLDRYGIANDAPQRFIGGLSPSHRRIVEKALSAPLGSAITMESISAQCQLSSRHFARAFRQSFGAPFYQFLLKARLQQAKRLLIETDISLREIAEQIGYADQATFTESFTRTMGVPPGRYRRRYGTAAAISV